VKIVLYAVSTPHCSELVETARRLGWEISASVRNVSEPEVPQDVPSVVEAEAIDPALMRLPFAVPQTNPAHRRDAVADAIARGFTQPVTMIDPTAAVASSAAVGDGCYVGAGAVVGAAAQLGDGCLINRSSSVAHHVIVGEYVGTGPGVVIAGSCRIDDGAFIGAGAVLAPSIRVGVGAVVGAGAVVIRDVEPGAVVVGNPARPLKSRR
jgi:sugar O-acyltransferase (sialic acid O-acetyltransferase NeuD family)